MKKALLLPALLAFAACSEPARDYYPGYVEADYVRLASPIAGTLAQLYVKRGDTVAAAAPAFVLEQENERAAHAEAQSRLARAQASLADLNKGKRSDELAVVQEQTLQAEAALKLSQAELAREGKLVAERFVAPARLDELRAAVARDRARVGELQAQLRVARLGGRIDALAGAEQDVKTARAQLEQADWRLAQKSIKVPINAQVADVLYRPGEMVPAGTPVVSLLAPEYLRARFFVPEAALGALRLGQDVTLSCDGCKAPVAAKISFIAREAEYTAPLIYSKENRATLVFMIEARPAPDAAAGLHPGQPLEIRVAARP